jgi:diadenosine tetraphosphate (Ap4A) HIT family hydrolase
MLQPQDAFLVGKGAAQIPMAGTECVFCGEDSLEWLLAEFPHFLVVADHAPVIPGHTLVIAREHLACYGVLPAEWEAELTMVQARVTAFLSAYYGAVSWFENGVFHQTVFHAHLHALPLGPVAPSVVRMADLGGQPARSRDDVRAWYAERGQYTFLQEPDGTAALFAAEEPRYRQMLMAFYRSTPERPHWRGPVERRMFGAPHVRELQRRWRESSAQQ